MESFIEQVVADHMTRNVKTVRRDLTLRELGDLFESEDFNTYPVEEGGQVVGLVSKFDHLACFIFTPAHMMPHYNDLMRRTVADLGRELNIASNDVSAVAQARSRQRKLHHSAWNRIDRTVRSLSLMV